MLLRFFGYFSYLRKLLGVWGALRFMWFYLIARLRGDRPGRLHYIPVGPYAFYFPLAAFFAGLFNEIFFNEEYCLEKTDVPLTAIDAGANIGVSLLYIKLQAPSAQVICIEPNPAAQAVLAKNIEANGWGNTVNVIPCALGRNTGSAQFSVLADAATDSSGSLERKTRGSARNLRSFTVAVEPLSRYIRTPIDFLKIDIEGAEFAVMEELRASGAFGRIKHIQLEYHDDPDVPARKLSEMLGLLEGAGYTTAVRGTVSARDLVSRNWRRNCMVYAWRR